LTVQTHGINLVDSSDARTEAKWKASFRELVEHRLVEDRGSNGEVFSVTDKGYRIADLLGSESTMIT
jgi:hypothetical protein